jgi:predicted PurR-regulated permease PerM
MDQEKSVNKHMKAAAYFLGFISFVLFVYILMALSDILVPITIAVFLTYLFHPLMAYLKKKGVPRWFSLILILLIVAIIGYLTILLLLSAAGDLPDKLQAYYANISSFLSEILKPFDLTVREFASWFKIDIRRFKISTLFEKLFEAGVIQNLFNSLSSMLGDFFISLVFWLFMMLGKEKFEKRLEVAFAEKKSVVQDNLHNINVQLQSYLIIKTILSLIAGIIVTVVLLIYGVDFALLWGVLTFVLNFIPNIGALIATLGPIIIALLQYGFGITVISLAFVLFMVHNIIGSLIEPHYLGRRMDLSPVFVLFSLIFWGWIWGIVGMFLAVPIAAAMKILFSNIVPLKPIAVLMGSKVNNTNSIINAPNNINDQ